MLDGASSPNHPCDNYSDHINGYGEYIDAKPKMDERSGDLKRNLPKSKSGGKPMGNIGLDASDTAAALFEKVERELGGDRIPTTQQNELVIRITAKNEQGASIILVKALDKINTAIEDFNRTGYVVIPEYELKTTKGK